MRQHAFVGAVAALALHCQASDSVMLDMPPRLMWGWEPKVSGYCGSASVQADGVYYGNWLTEDAIRGTSGGERGALQVSQG